MARKNGINLGTFEWIIGLLTEHQCEPNQLSSDSLFSNIVVKKANHRHKGDDLKRWLAMHCEDQFDLEIPDEDVLKFEKLGDLISFIEGN